MIYPTRRAVLATASGAPVALLLSVALPSAWVAAPLWVAVVLALVAIDAMRAPATPVLRVTAAGAVGVGAPLPVTLALDRPTPGAEVALETGPKLVADDLRPIVFDDMLTTTRIYRTIRRGTDGVSRAWLRWSGPMGLAWRQRTLAIDHRVVITPDIRAVRDEGALLLRSAQAGQLARIDRGEGSEFEALTEWRSGMDRRAIDWKQSARHHVLLAKDMHVERNNQIVFAVDAGRAMADPVDGVPRVDRAVTAALLAAYVALKLGDRVSLFGFDARPRIASGAVTGVRAFPALQRLAGELDYSTAETNHTLGLSTLAAGLTRRALVVIFTEITDQTGAELMIQAVEHLLASHLVLFVLIEDAELDALAAAAPVDVDAVSRAVTAAALLRERRLVMTRLRHLGIHVIEARHDRIGPALVRAYLDFKRRNLL